MIKKALLVAAIVAMGSVGLASSQNATSVVKNKAIHPRIFELKDRIKNQRLRIDQGLSDATLTQDQAQGCRDVLNSVEKKMKDEYAANGSKKTMRKEQYEDYNISLDVNSAILHEEKQTYYYYDPYYDQHYFYIYN